MKVKGWISCEGKFYRSDFYLTEACPQCGSLIDSLTLHDTGCTVGCCGVQFTDTPEASATEQWGYFVAGYMKGLHG